MLSNKLVSFSGVFASILAFSAATSASGAEETQNFPAQGVGTLDIENAQGQVTIEGGSNVSTFTVTFTKIDYAKDCQLTTEKVKDQLVIISKPKNKFWGKEVCKLNIAVKTPKSMDINVRLGSGDVEVKKVIGNLDFKIGSGDLKLADTNASKLVVRSGSGDVTIAGFVEDGEFKVGAGNIELTYDKAPTSGSLDMKIGSGTTTINLPETAKISSKFKSGTGSLTNELANSQDAKFKISGTTGTGDMVIKKF